MTARQACQRCRLLTAIGAAGFLLAAKVAAELELVAVALAFAAAAAIVGALLIWLGPWRAE